MNCYQHPGIGAVANCAQGCGRSLCTVCAAAHEPPTCAVCVVTIKEENIAEIALERSALIKRMTLNGLVLCAYVWFIIMAQGDHNSRSFAAIWLLVPMLIWGFFGFRWLMDAFHRVTGLITFDTLQGFGIKYLIGSILTAMTGLLVIPILLFMQWRQLSKLTKLE